MEKKRETQPYHNITKVEEIELTLIPAKEEEET